MFYVPTHNAITHRRYESGGDQISNMPIMDRGDIGIDALPPNSIDIMGGVAAFHKKEAAQERKEGEAR